MGAVEVDVGRADFERDKLPPGLRGVSDDATDTDDKVPFKLRRDVSGSRDVKAPAVLRGAAVRRPLPLVRGVIINPALFEICRLLIFTGVVGVEDVFIGVPDVVAAARDVTDVTDVTGFGVLLGKLSTLQMSRNKASLSRLCSFSWKDSLNSPSASCACGRFSTFFKA